MDLFVNSSWQKSNRFETAIWASKLVLMSMGILSTLLVLKVAVFPFTFNLVVSIFARLWVSARTLLSPPFVYVIVNFIIIIIVASSNFQHKSLPLSDSPPDNTEHTTLSAAITEHDVSDSTTHQLVPENQTTDPNEEKGVDNDEEAEVKDSVLSPANASPAKNVSNEFSPDSDDSLDGTWRAIMEGKGKTVTPMLKKSDTWTATIRKAEPLLSHGDGKAGDGGGDEDHDDGDPVSWAKRELRKSETFNDTASLRREKSMSPEELYKRAEAFIKNFNHQMKLQRLESYRRFTEMVNGVST